MTTLEPMDMLHPDYSHIVVEISGLHERLQSAAAEAQRRAAELVAERDELMARFDQAMEHLERITEHYNAGEADEMRVAVALALPFVLEMTSND